MDRDLLVKQLMQTFLDELRDHIGALNGSLLALEKGGSPEERGAQVTALFRTFHSLKGAARTVNVNVIENACHRLESILAAVRDGAAPLDAERFALFFAAADALEEATMRLREQADLTHSPLAELLPRLEAMARRGGDDPPLATQASAPVPPPPPAPPPEIVLEAAASPVVRVPAEKLDAFLAQSGELLLARRRIDERARSLVALRDAVARFQQGWRHVEKALGLSMRLPTSGGDLSRPARAAVLHTRDALRTLHDGVDELATTLTADTHGLDRAAAALDAEVRRIRMLPFATVCQGLDRLVRDLAQASGKEVELAIEGETVELDRSVLEGLIDPLRHLIRNALDHGIELPVGRQAAGKPARGRIILAARLRGDQVEVVVADDGQGIDLAAARRSARERGLGAPADDAAAAQMLFLPRKSTAGSLTTVSGRGVGLDVVKSRIEALRGTVSMTFIPGRGCRFTLLVPLTLTMLRAVLLRAGGQAFACPACSVEKLVRIAPGALRSVEGRDMLLLDGTPVPVAALAATLGLPAAPPPADGEKLSLLVIAAGSRRLACAVDEFLSEQQIVVKKLGPRIRRIRLISGATVLPAGDIALVLNVAGVIQQALRRPGQPLARPQAAAAPARRRILIAEDSLTTRTLEKSILEAAGYDVLAAADGESAWKLLQEAGADLLVSDVEMPRLNGFGLTEQVRASPRFRALPVILVTALESEADKARGRAAGADAYLVKSAFDQQGLLDTIGQLL